MSTASVARILAQTERRLYSASDSNEVRQIGLDHVSALGASLAETTFLQASAKPTVTRAQRTILVMHAWDGLLDAIRGSLDANGVRDPALRADHLQAAKRGFIDRLDELVATSEPGGCA